VLILALDTTTRAGSAAVLRDAAVLSLVHGDAARTHGERLPGELDRALREAGVGLREIDLLAVASGPGAFTGLRIGLAAVQGLAMVTRCPVVGVSALDATVEALWTGPEGVPANRVVVWMDAQRGEVFEGRFIAAAGAPTGWAAVAEPSVATPDACLVRLQELRSSVTFGGDGAQRYRDRIAAWSPHARVAATPAALAPAVARLGALRAGEGAAGPPHALQPLYVRRPDAELERQRRSTAS
jgi:tRNA threonylcarbamoyladenosine biosynthesis protein TsaB